MIRPGIHCHWHKNKIYLNFIPDVYHIYILQYSIPTKVTCTKQISSSKSPMSSYSSRFLITKSNFLAVYQRLISKWTSWAGTSLRLNIDACVDQYILLTDLYLVSILAHYHGIIIVHAIG